MRRVAWAVIMLLCASRGAAALTVEQLEVGEESQAYVVRFEGVLDAPAAAVMAVLRDYAGYPALDPRIETARLVGQRDGRPVLYTRLHGCVGSVFCRGMERYELLTEGERSLIAEALPGMGDLLSGRTETRLVPEGTRTRVSYHTIFQPAFWLPRWIVRSAMRRTLEEGTRGMFANVERIAGAEAAP